MRRASVRFSVWCILYCLIFLPNALVGQDLDSILRDTRNNRIDSSELFLGLEIEAETYIFRQSEGKGELFSNMSWSQSSKNVWRFDFRNPDEYAFVFVKNGAFSFEAFRENDNESFEFGTHGFGKRTLGEIVPSVLFRNPLLEIPTHVFEFDLVEFLELPSLEVESITSVKSKGGRNALRIKWSLAPFGEQFTKESFGEIVVLPEDGYLIEKTEFHFGSRDDETSSPSGFLSETVFDTIDGRFLPSVVIRIEPYVSYRSRLIHGRPESAESEFYTAESIGLKTPINPLFWKILWLMVVLLVLLGSIRFFRKR